MHSKGRHNTLLERLRGIGEAQSQEQALKVARGVRSQWDGSVRVWHFWHSYKRIAGAVAMALLGAAASAFFGGWLG
jgi:anti-sigma factor RsiW